MSQTILYDEVRRMIMLCRKENDVDKKIEIYNRIRKTLGYPHQLSLPSYVTDEYIDTVLDEI
jgi:hypothetical protein